MKSDKDDNQEVYCSIDVEIINGHWAQVAAVVSCYPTGAVVSKFEVYAPMKLAMSQPPNEFWNENKTAFDHIVAGCTTSCAAAPGSAEKTVIDFFDKLDSLYPNAWIISDNPVLDANVINEIFDTGGRHRKLHMTIEGNYRQVLCTWSYSLATRRCLGVTSRQIRANRRHQRPELSNIIRSAPTHTALSDAAAGASKYYRTEDTITTHKQRRDRRRSSTTVHPLSLSSTTVR
jgi:hypothetical protein